jgi:hypothetical protein
MDKRIYVMALLLAYALLAVVAFAMHGLLAAA